MKEYIHIFRDETSQGIISKNEITSGIITPTETSGIASGVAGETVSGVLKRTVLYGESKLISNPLNQLSGGMYMPARTIVRGLATGAGAMAMGGAVAMLAIKGIEFAISKHEEKIARLEQEAQEKRNFDNLLVKAGKFQLGGNAQASSSRYIKYTYDRS